MKQDKKMANLFSVIRTKIPRHFTQVLATLAVSLGPFAAGLGKGYTSPALASLKESKSSAFPVSPQEGSWIASLSLLGAIFGCLAGGLLLQFGRKTSLLLVALPFSGSWLLTVFASGVEMMYCSSFIAGFCSACILLATQVYVSEISHPEIRGCLSAILRMATHLGALCSTSLGAFLDWRQLAGAAALVPLLFFIAMLPIPETPSFLLYHSKEEDAARALSWLRSKNEDVSTEMETLRENILAKERTLLPRISSQLWRPLWITCGLMFFHKFSGVTVFNQYAVTIFQQVYNRSSVIPSSTTSNILNISVEFSNFTFGMDQIAEMPIYEKLESFHESQSLMVFGRSLNPHVAAVVVIFLQLLGSMTSGLLIDTAGRIPLLIVSSLFISGSFFGFGLYNWLEVSLPAKQSGFGPSLDWIPLTCVLFFTLFFSIGIGPISWLLVGELFPLEFRGFGGALCTSFSYGCAFLAVKTYEDIKSAIGLYGAFWIYSGISIVGLFFVSYAVPETKGIELEEMHHTSTTTDRPSSGIRPGGTSGQLLENYVDLHPLPHRHHQRKDNNEDHQFNNNVTTASNPTITPPLIIRNHLNLTSQMVYHQPNPIKSQSIFPEYHLLPEDSSVSESPIPPSIIHPQLQQFTPYYPNKEDLDMVDNVYNYGQYSNAHLTLPRQYQPLNSSYPAPSLYSSGNYQLNNDSRGWRKYYSPQQSRNQFKGTSV